MFEKVVVPLQDLNCFPAIFIFNNKTIVKEVPSTFKVVYIMNDLMRRTRKSVDRNSIPIIEPKSYCCIKHDRQLPVYL